MFRKIGIVGGLGWRSTVDYYAALQERAAEWSPASAEDMAAASLEISIESLDLSVAHSLLLDGETQGRWEGFDNYHRAALRRLERSEAELAVMACNTPHERLSSIALGTHIRIIDLFEAVSAEAARRGARRLLVLGTSTTMSSVRLHRLLAREGVEVVIPTPPLAGKLQQLIEDLQRDVFADAWERLLRIVHGALGPIRAKDFVGLNCTELSLALPGSQRLPVCRWQGIDFLNAAMVHVDAAIRAACWPVPKVLVERGAMRIARVRG